jgi:hypothetical protein
MSDHDFAEIAALLGTFGKRLDRLERTVSGVTMAWSEGHLPASGPGIDGEGMPPMKTTWRGWILKNWFAVGMVIVWLTTGLVTGGGWFTQQTRADAEAQAEIAMLQKTFLSHVTTDSETYARKDVLTIQLDKIESEIAAMTREMARLANIHDGTGARAPR